MKKLFEREFLLVVFTVVVAIAYEMMGQLTPDQMIQTLKWIAIGYATLRTIVKITPTKEDDKILEKIESVLKGKNLLKEDK